MGRFATTVDFYSLYREPYTGQFFQTVATQLALRQSDSLLDIGCGPALLALGFAPFVAHCTGIDPEPAMLQAAKEASAKADRTLELHLTRLEDFQSTTRYPILTIGRALHWLDREPSLAKLNELLAPGGRILICGASGIDTGTTPWFQPYNELRRAFASLDEKLYEKDGTRWFANSAFSKVDEITVRETRNVTAAELIGRALSKSNTSPAALGERRAHFEHEMTSLLAPFSNQGELQEHILARATVFARP
jgi:SAM-dependent methyltransferase